MAANCADNSKPRPVALKHLAATLTDQRCLKKRQSPVSSGLPPSFLTPASASEFQGWMLCRRESALPESTADRAQRSSRRAKSSHCASPNS